MTLHKYTAEQKADGTWQRVHVDQYDVTLEGNRLNVDGHLIPITYAPGWAWRVLKTQIQTNETPEDFFRKNFLNEFWSDKMISICDHVRKYGKKGSKE